MTNKIELNMVFKNQNECDEYVRTHISDFKTGDKKIAVFTGSVYKLDAVTGNMVDTGMVKLSKVVSID